MLLGNNRVCINHATMNAAIEEYLNRRLVGAKLEVLSVRWENDSFTCNVKGAEEPTDGQVQK